MEQICEYPNDDIDHFITISGKAKLPTKHGSFTIYTFEIKNSIHEPIALIKGDIKKKENILIRLHSECLTGDVFKSQRCDCGYQLHESMKMIAEEGRGIMIYLHQEGRGIGLKNKIKAYSLQDEGYDTVEANHLLGFRTDERDYLLAALILQAFKVKTIRLITNNPKKIDAMKYYGILVRERVPILSPKTKESTNYLETKKNKLDHLL